MKVKYNKTGDIVEIPDGAFNPNDYTQVGGSPQVNGGSTQTVTQDQNAGMKTLYQQLFSKAQTIKDRNSVASSYKTATGEELFGETAQTTAQKTAALKKSDLENIINMLETRMTTKKLAKGRIGGLLSDILGRAGFNADLVDYKTLRESVKPQLVKMAGDTGALSLVEQEAAIKSIPTEYSTPEEVAKQFITTREKFGIPVGKKKLSLEDIFGTE